MRFKRKLNMGKGLGFVIVFPLLNIALLLGLCLMLVPCGVFFSGFPVELPKALTSRQLGGEMLEISLHADGSVRVNGKKGSITWVKSVLKSFARADRQVLIKSEKNVALNRVVELWDVCDQSGIGRVSVAVYPE